MPHKRSERGFTGRSEGSGRGPAEFSERFYEERIAGSAGNL